MDGSTASLLLNNELLDPKNKGELERIHWILNVNQNFHNSLDEYLAEGALDLEKFNQFRKWHID